MSETNKRAWTPGKWSAEGAAVYAWTGHAPEHNVSMVAACGDDGDEEAAAEQVANARLIAAAPGLYEALASLVERYVTLANSGDCGFWNPEEEAAVIAARLALARARGEAE